MIERRRSALAALLAGAFIALAAAPVSALGSPVSTQTIPARSTATTATGDQGATPAQKPTLTDHEALRVFTRTASVSGWLRRYPISSLDATASFNGGVWTIRVYSGKAGIVATGAIADQSHKVLVAWAGPAVAWPMARGAAGSFGGKYLNSIPVFLAFAAAFLIGLADWRRPLSMRNLDLVALLGFGPSLAFFDGGHIFASVSLAYPSLVYLLARMAWIGIRGRPPRASKPIWPVWLLAAVVVFAVGFRVGFEISDSHVIDVGYAGVIGAERIAHGESPYGHMPITGGTACGPADITGSVNAFIQTNKRCEIANDHGDTYGPVSYEAYLPGYAVYGWKGATDHFLNAARLTSILFDFLCIGGLAILGWRLGGGRLSATLAVGWVTYPFTQYALNSNTNDMVQAFFLILALLFIATPFRRGFFGALASLVKFAPLIVMPMWLTYPDIRASFRLKLRFVAGFLLATVLSFWILLLEPDPLHAASVFFQRALVWQIGRSSPFSLWDWRQYHAAGIPDLHTVQLVLSGLLLTGALAAAVWPRQKSQLQLVALTGALLIGFELVQTHWFYLYIPWFLPFVLLAILAPSVPPVLSPSYPVLHADEPREAVAA